MKEPSLDMLNALQKVGEHSVSIMMFFELGESTSETLFLRCPCSEPGCDVSVDSVMQKRHLKETENGGISVIVPLSDVYDE